MPTPDEQGMPSDDVSEREVDKKHLQGAKVMNEMNVSDSGMFKFNRNVPEASSTAHSRQGGGASNSDKIAPETSATANPQQGSQYRRISWIVLGGIFVLFIAIGIQYHRDMTDRDQYERIQKLEYSMEQMLKLSGWQRISNKRWYKIFRNKVTYNQAVINCISQGSHLAAVGLRDSGWRTEIIDSLDFSVNVWIGLDDKIQEGRFLWNDNVESTQTNTAWVDGQPDNSGDEDCCQVKGGTRNFNDIRCSTEAYYLCETNELF